jgi:hypothetical protein
LPIILRGACAFDLFQYVGSFGGPDKGFGTVVVMVDMVEDRGDQILDTAKDSPAQAIFGQVAGSAPPCSAMNSR